MVSTGAGHHKTSHKMDYCLINRFEKWGLPYYCDACTNLSSRVGCKIGYAGGDIPELDGYCIDFATDPKAR